jgi:uncharacterized glyoxalase superfamily protein PhnB
MQARTNNAGAAVVPTVRYRDVPAAIAWLCKAFGFEQHRIFKDKNGTVLYGQLTFGTGMVMVAPIQETPFGKLMVQPEDIGGVETQICYLYVADAKAHQTRAASAGAEIVLDIKGDTTAGRGYSCRDPEGHIWNFGTYDPWDLQAAAPRPKRSRRRRRRLAASLLLAIAGAGLYMHEPSREIATELALTVYAKAAAAIESAQAEQAERSSGNDASDRALAEVREQLAKERIGRLAADRHVKDIRDQLASERRAREAAEGAVREAREARPSQGSDALKSVEHAAAQARDELAHVREALETTAAQLAQTREAKDVAELSARELREQLAQLRSTREAAERAAREAREQASRERSARIAAERAAARKNASPSLF